MKFKKFASLALAAVTTFSAVSASAINVPTPNNNKEAYAWAEAFYHDGYFYEAKAELNMVDKNDIYYDANKQAEWMAAVDVKIAEVEYNNQRAAIKALLAQVKKLNSQYKFQEGLNLLATASNYTPLEYYSLKWWEDALLKNLYSGKYDAMDDAVKTGLQAIEATIKAGGVINSVYETYSPVKVDGGYHVYIKTRTPDGKYENVAAFIVDGETGYVTRAF